MFDHGKMEHYYDRYIAQTQKDCSQFSNRPEVRSCIDSIFSIGKSKGLFDGLTSFLDIGGGGYAYQKAEELGLSAKIITIDKSEQKILNAKGYDVYLQDMNFISFADGSIDVIFASHILEHSLMPLLSLHEWSRVLSNDGVLVLYGPVGIDRAGEFDGNSAFGLEEHIICYTDWQYRWLFKQCGFKVAYSKTINRRNRKSVFRLYSWIKRAIERVGLSFAPKNQLPVDMVFFLKK